MGCDLSSFSTESREFVSIHAPTWGATIFGMSGQRSANEFQSTHPHGVRPKKSDVMSDDGLVSIHAPTWGATLIRSQAGKNDAVSIHAPTWGATHKR